MTATHLARSVVGSLIRAGVTDVVLAPGSRNAPLAFAAHDAAEAGLLRLHTRIDERTAGFLALGLARTGPPAAVVCTSGTAVANLHPAVLEAAHAGVPLVAVTADRPARLRGTGANQTTDQVGVFGPLVATHDLDAEPAPPVLGGGPLHLNVQLDEPLVPDDRWVPDVTPGEPPQELRPAVHETIALGPRTVVVAGDDAGPPARILAEQAGWPLFAEPTSGSRTGDHPVRSYRLLLDGDLGRRIERVVVFGHPTLSRPVGRLLARDDVTVLDAGSRGAWSARPFRVDDRFVSGRPTVERADDPAWLAEWRAADASVSRRLDELLAAEPDLTVVVVNDDGGSIFATLEQGAERYADRYDTLFGTPHGVDLAALCAATRTPHWRAESLPELEQALGSPNGGVEVVEVRVRRDNRRALDERIRALRP